METPPKKNSCISGNRFFLEFRTQKLPPPLLPPKFFIFQRTKLSYISGGTSKAPKTKFLIFIHKNLQIKFSKNTLG